MPQTAREGRETGHNASSLKSVLSCHVVQRYEYIQCRVEPELRQRLSRLRTERDVNVSAWIRRVLSEALDREFPSPQPAPIPGWETSKLSDGSLGSLFQGDASALPNELVGARIAVRTGGGVSFTTTVREVLERSTHRILVRDSGWPPKEKRK